MVKFIILRHGYSEGNKEKRFSGQLDVHLDVIGKRQAISVAEYISKNFKVDSIYSSDLVRALETSQPLCEKLGLPVQVCSKLREANVGKWQGILIEDIKKQFPESFELYRTNPGISKFDGGESYEDVMRRAKAAFEEIAEKNDGKTVVVVTHGGVIRTLRAAWTNVNLEGIKDIPHVANASVTIVNYNHGNVEFVQTDYTEHLDDKATEERIK